MSIDIGIKEIHIGHEIDKRREQLKMSKSEFGRLIGVRQQHINKLLLNDSIESSKLVKISHVLNCNFFAMFCNLPTNVSACLSSISMGNGDAHNIIGDTGIASQMELQKQILADMNENKELLKDQIKILKDQVRILESNLKDKDDIIELYKRIERK